MEVLNIKTEMPTKLKQRFCKDMGLTIQIFKEPYFSERLEMLGYTEKYERFRQLVAEKFENNEEKYFEYYNSLKDKIIDFIKESEAYKELTFYNRNKHTVTNIRQSDVYKVPNIGKSFISIDMKKANFSAMVQFGLSHGYDFYDSYDYEKFMRQFTDVEHFIESKYIRQVVFGNCNCKGQVSYEKELMTHVMYRLLEELELSEEAVYSMCSDEIILYAEALAGKEEKLHEVLSIYKFPLKVETFTLSVVTSAEEGAEVHNGNIYSYIKNLTSGERELKCIDPVNVPFVIKLINGRTVTDSDLVFFHNGRLARFLEAPKLRVVN